MAYQCPKGHQSTDPDYCSECGALIGKAGIVKNDPYTGIEPDKQHNSSTKTEICPDCGTQREGSARFCEVCRHDFLDNKTGVAEAIVAAQNEVRTEEKADKKEDAKMTAVENESSSQCSSENAAPSDSSVKEAATNDINPDSANNTAKPEFPQKLNVIITVDKNKAAAWNGESPIRPDTADRIFPLDLDENLVGRRSNNKGIYPEIEVNDPGVSHRHLKFIKQTDGGYAALELGSSNGTELNGIELEPGISTLVKAGDELLLGIWSCIKIAAR